MFARASDARGPEDYRLPRAVKARPAEVEPRRADMPASFIEPSKATEVKFTSCCMIVVQLLCFPVVLVLIMSILIFSAELFVTYCAVLCKCYCRVFWKSFLVLQLFVVFAVCLYTFYMPQMYLHITCSCLLTMHFQAACCCC